MGGVFWHITYLFCLLIYWEIGSRRVNERPQLKKQMHCVSIALLSDAYEFN